MGALSRGNCPHRRRVLRTTRRFPPEGEAFDGACGCCPNEDTSGRRGDGGDRADLVLAGAAILQAIQEIWPCARVRVADRGLREGVLLAMMAERSGPRRGRRRRRRPAGKPPKVAA